MNKFIKIIKIRNIITIYKFIFIVLIFFAFITFVKNSKTNKIVDNKQQNQSLIVKKEDSNELKEIKNYFSNLKNKLLTSSNYNNQPNETKSVEDISIGGIIYCDTLDDVANIWASIYRDRSRDFEYGAILYTKIVDGKNLYYCGRTYRGFESNTIPGFIIGWTTGLIGNLIFKRNTVGFIHSHPYPGVGYHNDFFSSMDKMLIHLYGIDTMYLVPYTNCIECYEDVDEGFIIIR